MVFWRLPGKGGNLNLPLPCMLILVHISPLICLFFPFWKHRLFLFLAGAGVPTLPVRIPQIVDYADSYEHPRLSFTKLIDIVIMISSSQQQGPTAGIVVDDTTTDTKQRVQYHVLLSFPNPHTKNSVMISSAEELLQLMERHKAQHQLTLIAKVQQEIVMARDEEGILAEEDKPANMGGNDATTMESHTEAVIIPAKDTVPVDNNHASLSPVTPDRVVARAILLDDTTKAATGTPETVPATPASPDDSFDVTRPNKSVSRQLDFDPVEFQTPDTTSTASPVVTNATLASFMEQLLQVQGHRMQAFANHMEDRLTQAMQQQIVTSEDTLKQCLRETVQVLNDDDRSVSSDDSSDINPTAVSGSPLEKIVKDQMVSMELRFAKLEEQLAQTAAYAGAGVKAHEGPANSASNNNTDTGVVNGREGIEALHQRLDQMETRLDQRFENMQHQLVMLQQDAESKNATLSALAMSPAWLPRLPSPGRKASTGNTGSSKPPLPPHHQGRSVIGTTTPTPAMVDPTPLFLPRMAPFSLSLPPVSPTVLSTPLPPSIPSSPQSQSSPSLNPRPPSPVTVPVVSNQMRPVSPPPTERTSNINLPPLAPLTPSPPSSPPGSSSASRSASVSTAMLEDFEKSPTSSNYDENQNEDARENGMNVDDATLSPIVTTSHSMALSMPSLGPASPSSSPERTKKQSVRGLFMPAVHDVSADGGDNYSNTTNIRSKSLPIELPMLDASVRDISAFSPSTPPTSNSLSNIDNAQGAISDNRTVRSSERKMKKAIKDHMDSMESRVSKLREMNRRASTSAITSTATPETENVSSDSTARALFSASDDSTHFSSIESMLTEKLDAMAESLQTSVKTIAKESLNLKLVDIEKLLERKFEHMEKTAALSSTSNDSVNRPPPNISGRQTSLSDLGLLQELIDRRMGSLELVVQSADMKLQAQEEYLDKNVALPLKQVLHELNIGPVDRKSRTDDTGGEYEGPKADAGDISALQDALDRRMDTIESLVQLTATELESSTTASQKRLHLALLDQILDILEPRQQQRGVEDASVATSSYPTMYGDEGVEESVRKIYGDMDIDDPEATSCADRTSLEVVGRGMSLRDMCDIGTIIEGDEIDDSARSGDTAEMVKQYNESVGSELSARSASVKNIYGDMDIDATSDHSMKIRKDSQASESFDLPPQPVQRRASEVFGRKIPIEQNHRRDSAPAMMDGMQDVQPSPVDRALSVRTFSAVSGPDSSASNGNTAPSAVDQVLSTREIQGESNTNAPLDSSSSEIDVGDSSHCASLVSIDDDASDIDEAPEDIYDSLSLDGVDESHTFVTGLSESQQLMDTVSLSSDDWGDVDELSVCRDDGYESDSSCEDDEYFNDHTRQYLVVLANAMGRVRAAKRGTNHYRKYQQGIFAAKRDGPLAMKVKSVAEYDTTDMHEDKMTMSDDSLGDESETDQLSEAGLANSYDNDSADELSAATGDEGVDYTRERARENALIMARAVAKRRASDRGAKIYRRMLNKKFTPKARRGPLAIVDKSEGSLSCDENLASDSSASNVYIEDSKDAGAQSEASQPSIDSFPADSGHALSVSKVDWEGSDDCDDGLQVSQPSTESFPADSERDLSVASTEISDEDFESNKPNVNESHVNSGYVGSGSQASDSAESALAPQIAAGADDTTTSAPDAGFDTAEKTSEEIVPTTRAVNMDAAAGDDGKPGEATSRKPVYALFDADGYQMDKDESEHRSDIALLMNTQPLIMQEEESDDAVWESFTQTGQSSQHDTRDDAICSVRSQHPNNADPPLEEGAVKPENMSNRQSPAFQEASLKPFDESERTFFEVAEIVQTTRSLHTTPTEENADEIELEEKEMEEWKAVANWRNAAAERKDKQDSEESKESSIPETPAPDVVDAVERVLILDHLNAMKAQMKNWEDVFLASHSGIQASNDLWKTSNERLHDGIFESIEDSHHFAAYLDNMLGEKIGQLEEAIRSQTLLASNSLVNAAANQGGSPQRVSNHHQQHPGVTPPRARSAPTSPAHMNWSTTRRSLSRSTNPFDENGSNGEDGSAGDRDMTNSMVVTLTEWKRLQEQLRGTEEVAEAYRRQVLQLRNVLETKINEGNASLHKVEVLKRKLDDAHDREVQAQKQLRPVTRRVEQVIQEMVELEEHSASLQLENGMLREQLWKSQREC